MSNEITALPELLALLTLEGWSVTADAMHCQKATAQAILARGGDDGLAVKGNQPTLLAGIQLLLDDPETAADDAARTVDGDHGRIETRWADRFLDVVLDEDRVRARKDHAPENLARLRRFALDILRANKDKGATRGKIKRAAWDDAFLLRRFAKPQCDGLDWNGVTPWPDSVFIGG